MAEQATWDARFLQLAETISSWSEDRDFHVGAVIVGPDHEIRATGYNGLPRGVASDDPARFDRASGEKFYWFEHAERNAIYNAARIGVPLIGCTIYINRFPCADCTRAIIQCGIDKIICPEKPAYDAALGKSFDASEIMIQEGKILCCPARSSE